MITRRAYETLRDALATFPAVALLGPRQVGKTTLARRYADETKDATYLDLERPSDVAKLADPEAFLSRHTERLVVLDEVQRAPEIFRILRSQIDDRRRAGRGAGAFLILGSASLDLLRQSSESLAGRILQLELTPVLADELDDASPSTLDKLWLRGGFPESLVASTDAGSLRWRQAFLRTYLERDVPALGLRVPAETLRRFWTMLAHLEGQQINLTRLGESLGTTHPTVRRYLDLLTDLLLVRQLAPFAANVGKRLVRTPKVYVRDSGLVHALLGIETMDGLLGHPVAGSTFEAFVIEALVTAAGSGAHASYYRTTAGAEIDLVIETRRGARFAIDIKRSTAPEPRPGFYIAADDIRATETMIVYPGRDSYPGPHGVMVRPIREAASRLRAAGGT